MKGNFFYIHTHIYIYYIISFYFSNLKWVPEKLKMIFSVRNILHMYIHRYNAMYIFQQYEYVVKVVLKIKIHGISLHSIYPNWKQPVTLILLMVQLCVPVFTFSILFHPSFVSLSMYLLRRRKLYSFINYFVSGFYKKRMI